ncbi:hypothetical protein Tco_0766131 [Tanacetum coccineum]
MGDVDIETLTMEQYLALARGNQRTGIIIPEIEGKVNFEIKSQFLRELRENTLSGSSGSYTKTENRSPFKRPSLEDTISRCLEESSKRQDAYEEWMRKFRESTDRSRKKHDSTIKGLEKKVEQLAQAVTASMTNESKSVNQVRTIATKSSSFPSGPIDQPLRPV